MGMLSIVATPIGNLEDITLRALRTLKECDVIYAEDTRVISKLLARYEIKKPLQRLDAATESKKADDIIARLLAGERVVYVSDAGTPGISDPGAGLDAASFTFLGFLPHKKGRQTALKKLSESEIPVVLYESPHRILKLLEELLALEVSRVTVARELTKIHEELISGSVEEVQAHFAAHPDAV